MSFAGRDRRSNCAKIVEPSQQSANWTTAHYLGVRSNRRWNSFDSRATKHWQMSVSRSKRAHHWQLFATLNNHGERCVRPMVSSSIWQLFRVLPFRCRYFAIEMAPFPLNVWNKWLSHNMRKWWVQCHSRSAYRNLHRKSTAPKTIASSWELHQWSVREIHEILLLHFRSREQESLHKLCRDKCHRWNATETQRCCVRHRPASSRQRSRPDMQRRSTATKQKSEIWIL